MISVLAWLWIALLLVGQPLAALRGRRRLAAHRPPRARLYRGSAFGIGAIGAVTLALDLAGDRSALAAVTRGPSSTVGTWAFLSTLACALLWLGAQWARRMRWERPGEAYFHFLPRSRGERLAFVGLALLAGLAEEYAVRGFAFQHLAGATGSLLVAAGVTTVGFGLGHAYQGPSATIRTTLAGAILVVPVVASGLLVPSMIAHAALDGLTGLATLPLLSAWGVFQPDRHVD